jgi:hypothetical protein
LAELKFVPFREMSGTSHISTPEIPGLIILPPTEISMKVEAPLGCGSLVITSMLTTAGIIRGI